MESSRLEFDPIVEAHRNWLAHGWPEPEAMAAVTSLTRAHQIVLKRVDAVLRPLQLTFARYEALVLLVFARTGSLPLGKMGDRLQVHPASVTNAVDRLEAVGYVRRVKHPTDGRTTLAELTPAGREVALRATELLGAIRYGADGLDDDAARTVTEQFTGFRRLAGDF